jgi:hypothetical protein
MKRSLKYAAGVLLLLLIITGVSLSVFFNFSAKHSITTDRAQTARTVAEIEAGPAPDLSIPAKVIEPEVLQINSLRLAVDPREELLSIILLLSDYDPQLEQMTKFDFAYSREIRTAFDKYRNHDAVKIFNKLWRINFSYDTPPTAVLYLTYDFRLRQDTPITNYLKARAGSEKVLLKFLEALRRFSDDSQFAVFFNRHREYYRLILREAGSRTAGKDYIRELEAYYGVHNASYTIILVSLFRRGGYGPRVDRPDGSEIYAIIGARGMNDFNPTFGTRSDFLHIMRHECSHSFVNPVTEKNKELVRRYAHLFTPVKDTMQSLSYGEWPICLNEHLVRAVTIRLAYRDNKEMGKQALDEEKRRGFLYIDCLTDRLIEYENNRDRYPTFESFYPTLLGALDTMY